MKTLKYSYGFRSLTSLLPYFIFFCFFIGNSNAATVEGRVVSDKGKTVSYASVYLKNQPQVGTICDVNGRFSLEVADTHDSLIVSLVGYETVFINLRQVNLDKNLVIKLKEQPVILNEVVVTVNKKAKKKTKKEEREYLSKELNKLYLRICADFPSQNLCYHVVSTMKGYSGNQIVVYQEMIGDIVELRDYINSYQDSIQIKADVLKYYYNKQARENLNNINPGDFKKKDREMMLDIQEAKNETKEDFMPHRTVWELDMVNLIEHYYKDVKHWNRVEKDDKTVVFTLTLVNKMPGIFTLTRKLIYAVDKQTYSVKTLSERVIIDVNIPFGYKLSPGQLTLLNVFMLDNNKLEKYRVKSLHGVTQRNNIFKREAGQLIVEEKNFTAESYATDRNDQRINISFKMKAKALSVKTKDVKPYPASELKKYKTIGVPKP